MPSDVLTAYSRGQGQKPQSEAMEQELGGGSEASHDSWWKGKERGKRGEQPVGVFKGQPWKDWIEERVRVAIPAEGQGLWEAWDGELPSRAEEPDCDGSVSMKCPASSQGVKGK